MTDLERTFADAFMLASQSRKLKGLPRLTQEPRRARDGSRRIGPGSYKITMWLQPWHYADLVHAREADKFTGSLHKYLERMIEMSVPRVAARPEPTKSARKKTAPSISPVKRKRLMIAGEAQQRKAAAQ